MLSTITAIWDTSEKKILRLLPLCSPYISPSLAGPPQGLPVLSTDSSQHLLPWLLGPLLVSSGL